MISSLPPLLAFVVSLLIFFGYVSPTYSGSITDLKAAIEREQSALDEADRFTAKQSELVEKEHAMSEADVERLGKMLPDFVDNVRVIIDLTTHMKNSNVLLTSINVPPPSPLEEGAVSAPVGQLDFTLSVRGTYDSFMDFLVGIERSLRLLDVVKINITGSDTGVYTYDLTLRLYWLR